MKMDSWSKKVWKIFSFCVIVLAMCAVPRSISAQQSQNMTLLSTWDDNTLPSVSGVAFNDLWGYAAGGREYAIVGTAEGTQIVDVTSPTSPQPIAFEYGGSTMSVWRDYKTYGNFLYAVSDQGAGSSLQVFDLSSLPTSLTKVYDSQAIFSRAHNLFVDPSSGHLYVAGASNASSGIHILDIATDPGNPTLLATFNLGAYVHDVYVTNDTCYAFMGTQGWGIFDFSNLASPSLINLVPFNAYPENGYAHSGWISEDFDYLYWCDETHDTGIHIGNISDPTNPTFFAPFRSTLLAPTETNSIPHNAFVKGNQLYISYYHDGVQIYDITNRSAPVRAAYYDTEPGNTDYTGFAGCWGVYPYLPSGIILGTDIQHGLFVLQENTLFPVTMGEFDAENTETQVRLRWSTHSETNNEAFLVERSGDGITFAQIDRVTGAGNSIGEIEYEIFDELPLEGESHYRLKQIDFDGGYSYSEIATVNRGVDLRLMDVFPSPASSNDQVKVRLALEKSQQVQIKVTNLIGQQVLIQEYELDQGIQTLDMPPHNWSAGVYYVLVQGKTTLAQQKLIIGN
jgi:choice-of-anchor B domain-containing protein